MGLCSETEAKTQKEKRNQGVLVDVRLHAGRRLRLCVPQSPRAPCKAGPITAPPPGPERTGRVVAGRAWPSALALDVGAVARSDLRVRPGARIRQARRRLSRHPRPPRPQAALPRSALLPGSSLNIYTCLMQRWAPMAWSGTQTTVKAFRASF